ncbi:MAG: 3-phosphoserine/phosphohydroxythreonine transaminase [Rhodanobacteraceae bacterium]
MSRKWNFSAGPAGLPEEVLQQAQQDLLDWRGQGASVMELSHRGQPFMDLAAEIESDLRNLTKMPPNYRLLFLHGGATQHFAQIPMNFAQANDSADYLVTGHWGEKAVSEAGSYVGVRVAASGRTDGYRSLPQDFEVDPGAAYLHYTSNETIHGVEFTQPPDGGEVPVVADMSSDFLSRPMDIARFGLIYAGAQKNIGPSGLVLMLVRDDLLERPRRPMARIFDYSEIARRDSMLNTPNTWAWYLAGLNFKWLAAHGGLAAMGERNRAKADLLYATIDGSGGFYSNPVEPAARSRMNVPFFLDDASLDDAFLRESAQADLLSLKGHRALGGMRASIYNAMPLQGVQVLTDFMRDFARRHG